MVQLGLTSDFKRQVLKWDGATVNMKDPIRLLGQSNRTKCDMCKVVIQTVETASTKEDTEQMVKIINSNYAKSDLKQVADNATHMNDKERTLLLNLLEDF